MMSLWSRLPVAVRAVVIGLALATIVTVPWAVLAQANVRYWSAVPWAVPVTALYLWLWWQYVSGKGWPQSTAPARRRNLRAHRISEEASFRGYMQGPIERRHGPVVAILVTGTLFGLAHFTHPGVLVWAFKALAAVARPSPELDAIVVVE